MKRVALLGGLVGAGIVSVGGCTQILGDFAVGGDGGPGVDASIEASIDAQADSAPLDSGNDQGLPPDTGPNCGVLNDVCCAQAPACKGNAACCGGKCLDVSKDPLNCGVCKKDCRGGLCAGGKCQPVWVGGAPDKDPTGLLLGPTSAYFSVFSSGNNGKLYECDIVGNCQGGATMRIGSIGFAGNIVQDPSTVYLADFNGSLVYYWDKSTQTYSTRALTNPYGIDIDAQTLFVASNSTAFQMQTNLQNPIALSGQEGVSDIAADGLNYVYWTRPNPYEIRVGKYGQQLSGNPFHTAAGQLTTIAVSKNYVAWNETNLQTGKSIIYACPGSIAGCTNPTVLGQGYTVGIRLDTVFTVGLDVYWTAADYVTSHVQVYKCAVTGCGGNPTLLADVATVGLPTPGQITRDQTFVYFLVGDNNGTRLFRVADY